MQPVASSSGQSQRVIFSTLPPSATAPVLPPLITHLNALMGTLSDAPQDDVKFQALKEISENMEELFGTHSYIPLVENLIQVFMKILHETHPQFIAENNTLQLRKLIFELLFRLSSSSEVMKIYSKNLQQILLRLIYRENEENALLIIKILTDHIKNLRPQFSPELTTFFIQWKNAYNEMFNHLANDEMFLQRNLTYANKSLEENVVDALKTCYYTVPLNYSPQQVGENAAPTLEKYTLIPRASQSVKVFAEMSVLLLVLIQAHRQQLLGEILEIVPIFVRYINVSIPPHVCEDKTFHKELVEEFHNSQVRALTFIAYTARQPQIAEVLNDHSKAISDGILSLFDSLHDEVVNQRREMLLAIKYFFQSEFRAKFITVIPKMFDEKALLGSSFTSQDQLRNVAYSMLADILHHVRMNLDDLLVHMFFHCSRNLYDQQLLPYVQTMYGKLMMNLIEPMMVQSKDCGEEAIVMRRKILCNAIHAFVRKARQISEYHLPSLIEKYQTPQPIHASTSTSNDQVKNLSPIKGQKLANAIESNEIPKVLTKHSIAFEASQAYWQDPLLPLLLNDCKNMIRFIIQPTKMLVIALKEMGIQTEANCVRMVENLLSELFVHGLKCLDIFMIGANAIQGQIAGGAYPQKFNSSVNVRSKEEKETMEAFMAIYTNIDSSLFEKILEQHIELLIERVLRNPVLQNICNHFFTHPNTMRKMGVILVKFLLSKLPELGANSDRATLYLKLFKLIFHTLSYAPNPSSQEQIQILIRNCDIILKPFLHRIVQDSMQLAISSRESSNYFLLLRALFRSIGSGAHDHLYQQFLPLLPSILQKLNRLQNGSHRQPIHELFVELCLTVPVRLSTLLPYLPLLMDPLVCALNGSPTLVQQGLRTLELCVDNLQPDYFYDQMQPVRAALMKGLWRTVSSGDTQSASVALRILGKFGSSNRKVLMDAQTMDYSRRLKKEGDGPNLEITFPREKLPDSDQAAQIEQISLVDEKPNGFGASMSVDGLVETALTILRTPTPADATNSKIQACEFIKTLLLANIRSNSLDAESMLLTGNKLQNGDMLAHHMPTDQQPSIQTLTSALHGLFIAVFNVETRQQILPYFRALIKHLTIQSVLESSKVSNGDAGYVHSLVLIDAIAQTLGDSCKDYCHTAIVAIRLLIDTASSLLDNDREKASQLPLFSYLVEKITALCYRREWYARLGGCTAMRLIIEHYPLSFVKKNAMKFLDGSTQIISGLSDELSSGAFDFASKTIDLLLNACFQSNGQETNKQILESFIENLVDNIDDPEPVLRNECIRVINSMATKMDLPLEQILRPSIDVLELKLLKGLRNFPTISINYKIAIIEIYLFITKIDGFEFGIQEKENANFAQNLLKICKSNDRDLKEMLRIDTEYKATNVGISNYVDVEEKLKTIKKASAEALIRLYFNISAQYNIGKSDFILQQIFQYFVDFALETTNEDLNRPIITDGITKILKEFPSSNHHHYIDQKYREIVREFREKKLFISKSFFKKLTLMAKYSSQKVPVDVIKRLTDDLSLIMQTSSSSLNIDDIECVVSAVEFFHESRHYENASLVNELFQFFTQAIVDFPTKTQMECRCSVSPFLLQSPSTLAKIILTKKVFCCENSSKFVQSLIVANESAELRKSLLQQNAASLIKSLVDELLSNEEQFDAKLELNLLKFIATLLENQSTEYSQQHLIKIFSSIRLLWASKSFQERHSIRTILPPKSDGPDAQQQPTIPKILDETKFETPEYCVRIMLRRLRNLLATYKPDEEEQSQQQALGDSEIVEECVDLLYELTFAFVHNYASDFTFLRKFIDDEIIPKLPLSWRRSTFFKVIKLLKEDTANGHSMHLVRFMQYIVAPVFAYAFEINDIDLVVGGPSPGTESSEQNDDQNIVSVLCKEIIQRLTTDRSLISNTLTILLYMFCSLMVQKCPMHIYDPAKKQQGNRQEQGNLRHFMLFGWPCLQQSFRGDMTEKYAGHFLIANIIDQFSINRTIILQVLNSLMQAHHPDNREMIKKSLDILIPAVPRRMLDGHSQLAILIKKVLIEECRNSPQLIHCLQIIVRHYKVFYHIRHQIAQLILTSMQRLLTMQSTYETKRLLLEICEIVIKWEHDRQASSETMSEETQLAAKPVQSTVPDVPMPPAAADLHKMMDKQFIDNIIVFLFRIATSTEPISSSTSTVATAMEQINRRAMLLLRNALKPNVFGNFATIRTHLLEKQLQLPNPEQFSTGNEAAINHQLQMVNITLDVLSNIIHHLSPQTILDIFQPLQRALISCMNYSNSQQILRSTYNILSRLLEKTKSSPKGLDEFDFLNQHISRCIHDAFNNYASTLTSSPPMTIITLLRLMHSSQPAYLETVCLTPFVRLLQRLVREYVVVPQHGSSAIDQAQKLISDLLSICLEVLSTRTKHFNGEAQRNIVQFVLLPLIEKNAIDKILENIIKISLEILNVEIAQYEAELQNFRQQMVTPMQSLGAQVLIKMFSAMDQRFVTNFDLRRQFLNAILIVYENQELLAINFNRLKPAYYWGLCSSDRNVRNRYFSVFEKKFPKEIVPRLAHIMSKENWEMMGGYFWLGHVVHLLLRSANTMEKINLKNCATFANVSTQKESANGNVPAESAMEVDEKNAQEAGAEKVEIDQPKEDEVAQELADENGGSGEQTPSASQMESREASMMRISFSEVATTEDTSKKSSLEKNVAEIQNNLISLTNDAKLGKLVENLMDILHFDKALCHKVFVELFSSLWSGLSNSERDQILIYITPFLTSATMCAQRDSQLSVTACFLDAFIRCVPPIKLDVFVLNYIGSNHRCWHLILLHLEQLTKGIKLTGDSSLLNPANLPEEKLEVLDALAQLYQQLNELDQYVFVWRRRAYFEKTIKCLSFYQQGDYIRARETAEKLMAFLNEKMTKTLPTDTQQFSSPAITTEWHTFERYWINSCKQLNDWSAVEIYAGSEEVADPTLLADTFWHLHDWKLMKECLVQVDASGNPETFIKSTLLKLMMNIANFDQQEQRLSKGFTEKSLIDINKALIRDWRKLPPIVSHSHSEILHYTHLSHEVHESATVLLTNLQSVNFPSSNNGSNGLNHDMKKLVKSWRNRSMTFVDQLTSWHDQFTWRFQFFYAILRFYESTDQKSVFSIPLHAIAQTQLEFTRTLRHSNQIDLALAEMNKLHSAIMIHPMDVHSKLVEYIKCLLKLSSGEPSCNSKKMAAQDSLVEALDMIEGTQFQMLKRDQIARLMVYKGILLNRLDKREEAGKAFSAAAQLEQVHGAASSVWKHWGDFLTNNFLSNNNEIAALNTGMQAITCTLEHAKIVKPLKSRAAIAKLLWLIKIASSTSEKVSNAIDELLAQYIDAIPPANWIFWLNAIVSDVQQRQSKSMVEILKVLSKTYPQQIFYALRLELGSEKVTEYIQQFADKQHILQVPKEYDTVEMSDIALRTSTGRLISVLRSICQQFLGDIDALNKIMNELDNFPINPIERTLNEFKQILAPCHFELFTKISELTTINAEQSVVKRLITCIQSLTDGQNEAEMEICSKLKEDFSFLIQSKSSNQSLHKITSKMRKWIPRLCNYLRSFIGERNQMKLANLGNYMSRFKSSMAQIDIFDGHFGPELRETKYNAQISQFLPIYEEFIQNESICRLIRIRSLNGKIYSYQLERVRYEHASRAHIFQLFSLLNTEFAKSRNTAQRHMQFAIPQIIFTGSNSRLIECCPLAGTSSQYQNSNSDHSSENFVLFIDILNEMLNKKGNNKERSGQQRRSSLAIVEYYYKRLAEQRYSHKTIHDVFNQISVGADSGTMKTSPSHNVVSVQRDLLSRWMSLQYPDPISLWIARKKLAIHFAMLGLSEHTFFLSSMTPEGLVLDLSTAQIFFMDYKFDLTKKTCETLGGKVQFIELDANRPVPFRLTSNISHFLDASIEGHLTGALTAISRSFSSRSLEIWLRPILWDVFSKSAEDDPRMNIVNPVKRAVDTILNRIKLISHFENGVGATSQLLMQAQLPDNLCRMDPGFHPWF